MRAIVRSWYIYSWLIKLSVSVYDTGIIVVSAMDSRYEHAGMICFLSGQRGDYIFFVREKIRMQKYQNPK